VAQYKNVNWSGNAKDWLRNAKSKGHSTGSTPGL
jgi:surface antigen